MLAQVTDAPRRWRRNGRSIGPPPGYRLHHAGFDDEFTRLREVLDRARQIQRDFSRAERTARVFYASANGAGSPALGEAGLTELGAKLPTVLDRLRQTAVAIHRDASSLEEVNERMASGAVDQSEAVARTTTTVEALSEKIDRISQNAEEAAEACERARHEARRGLEQVHTRHRGDGPAAGPDRGQRPQGPPPGRPLGRDRHDRRADPRDLQPDRHARPERHDRVGPRRRARPRVRRRRRGDPQARRAHRRPPPARSAPSSRRSRPTPTRASAPWARSRPRWSRSPQRVRETGAALERISEVAEHSARLVEGISRSTNDQVARDPGPGAGHAADLRGLAADAGADDPVARVRCGSSSQSCEPWQRLAAADPVRRPGPAERAVPSLSTPGRSTDRGACPWGARSA